MCISTCCKQTFRKAFGHPFSLHGCPTVLSTAPYYSLLDLALCTPLLGSGPSYQTRENKPVLPSFCRARGYVFALMMATACGSYAQRNCRLMGWKGEERGCHGLRHRKTRSLKSLEKDSSNFPDLATVIHPLAHHRKGKEKRQYSGDG